MAFMQTVALLSTLAATAAAHGHVQGIVADGVWYEGYNPSFQYSNPAPVVIGWSDPEDLSNGYIPPSNYSGPDIICHLGATPGGTAATVKAGGTVELQWTSWPSSHHGPVLNYLAKAGDSSTSFDWSSVDKTSLEFVKVDAAGLIDDSTVPGTWASDQLIANNNSWTLEIPSSIAPGMYVLRHEIIALHSAEESDGAQNYPQCINLEVTGTGTATPSGTLGEKLYTNTAAPGIMVNIYSSLSTYEIPGPTLWSGATATLAQSSVAITGAASVETGSSTVWGGSTTASTTSTSEASSATATATSTAAQSTSTAASTSTATDIDAATAQTTQAVTAAADASSVPTSSVSSTASAVASDILTQTIGTILPTTTAGAGDTLGDAPSKALPAGSTVKDLLQWVDYLVEQGFSAGSHQRDFRGGK